MKVWQNLKGASQSEALLNEIKGNLFEYLVAQFLSRHFKCEGEFLRSFSEVANGKAMSDLQFYQSWLQSSDPDLYARLPGLSQKVSETLIASSLFKGKLIKNVLVTGKSGAVSGQEDFKEADIWLQADGEDLPLSLKLCKRGAFVNTKSGGIRSFLTKYFSSFSKAPELQESLNQILDRSFQEMAESLYAWADIPLDLSDLGCRQFSSSWQLTELPGELPDEAREYLFLHYHRVISELHRSFQIFYEEDEVQFGRCLGSLVGMGLKNLVQVTCFHKEGKERYEFDSLKIYSWDEFNESLSDLTFSPLKEKISSFELGLGLNKLQIRVKPMNKFTVSALKVNCSLKENKG
ncbi:MAG: hypothetical protein K9K67_04060 [Bacteriovoracaceae bacterium]|nr:hypothetical protein [Bacteriovoracaceae bacterium]